MGPVSRAISAMAIFGSGEIPMERDSSQLTLTVDAGQGAEEEDRVELARRLRQEFLRADIDSEFARSTSLPAGAKGDPASLFSLLVSVAPAAVAAIAATLQLWLSRHDRASITIESGGEKLALAGTLSEDQKHLVEQFLERHKAPVAPNG
jgi:hypothetical protein